jgi:uncharacterized membrane protein YbaN (DUF454 family)
MKQIYIHKKENKVSSFFKENVLTPHKILLAVFMLLSGIVYYFFGWIPAISILLVHAVLFITSYYKYSVRRKMNEKVWDRYVEKYGNKKGNIPYDVKLRHLKVIKEGKEIKI